LIISTRRQIRGLTDIKTTGRQLERPQIAQLPGLANPLTVNEFIQLESEVVKD
jgi:hypothetical protein